MKIPVKLATNKTNKIYIFIIQRAVFELPFKDFGSRFETDAYVQ